MSVSTRTTRWAIAIMVLTSTSAWGQALKEVIVTAQRRQQNIQNVGISIAAIPAREMRSEGLASSIDAVTQVPNVDNYSPYGPGSSANIVIRGIGLNDFGEGNEAPVTTYVDGFYILSVPAVDFSMFDLDRIEVLRGPQGTLFGRNSTGGVVQFVTARPTPTPAGFLTATGGSFGEHKFEGAISGPISGALDGRLSFLSDHSDGYERNVDPALKPGGNAGADAVRGQLLWRGDGLTVLGKAEYGRVNVRQIYYEQIPAVQVGANGGRWSLAPSGTDFAGYNQLTFDNGIAAARDVADTNFPSTLRSHGTTLLLQVDKQIGQATLTAISGYLDMSRRLQEDCDASPNNICSAIFPFWSSEFTQEIRLSRQSGPTRWTAGVYYLYADEKNHPSATFNVPVSGPTAVSPMTGLYAGAVFPIALAADWKLITQSYSAFAQAEHDVSEHWTVIAGVRLTHDGKHFRDADNASLRQCNDFPAPSNCFSDYVAQPYDSTYAKSFVSGKLEADWHAAEGVLVYASASRGTKAGGFNNGFYPAGIEPAQIPYGNEAVYAYELGEKWTVAGGRARVDVDGFYYDYRHFQTFNWEGIGGLLVNNDATDYGGEAELDVRLIRHLTASLSVAALHTKIKGVRLEDGVTVTDTRMAMAPDFSASGRLTWQMQLGADGELAANWDFTAATSRYTNNFNDPASLLEGYFKHNANIDWWPNDHWDLGVYVRNIGNVRNTTKVFVFNTLGYAQTIYAMPRSYGGQVTYRW